MFSFGDPNDPKPDDQRFETEDAAIDAACAASETDLDSSIFAIWNDEDGEVVGLAWGGWLYST